MEKLIPMAFAKSQEFKYIFKFPSYWEVEYSQFAFDEVRDGTHDSPKESASGVPLITSKNLKAGYIDFSNTKTISFADHEEISKRSAVGRGDLLFSMIGTIGSVAIVPDNNNFSVKNVGLFRKNPGLLKEKYAFYWLQSYAYQKYLDERKRGGNQRFVSLGLLRESPIPIAPLNEQIRIANKLDSLLAKVDAAQARLEKIPTLLKRFRQSVLSAATSGELTREWRGGREPEWATSTLKNVASGFNYGSSAKSKSEGRIPVLRMGNLQEGKLDWEKLVFTSDDSEIEKYLLKKGDVLFNRTNSPELVGKTSIYRGERKAIFAGYLIRIKGTEFLDSEYLNIQLNTPHAREYCWQVKTDGVSQSNINAKKIQAYEFELPPVNEQKEIVRRVESLFALADTVEKQYLEAKKSADRLTQSLLAKAFRGELVPQDPNDEPASELLKRIQAERAEQQVIKKTRKKKSVAR